MKICVIGVGNEFRGDDAAGRLVVRRLAHLPGVRVAEESGEGGALMDAWRGADAVLLVDALESGGIPGNVLRLDARAAPIPARFFHYSTHAFSVAEAVELARALGELPPRLVLYGIEGRDFSAGAALSPEVAAAIDLTARRLQDEIQQLLETPCTNSI